MERPGCQLFDLKLWTVRSRLYRNRFSLSNTRWKALGGIYTPHASHDLHLLHHLFFPKDFYLGALRLAYVRKPTVSCTGSDTARIVGVSGNKEDFLYRPVFRMFFLLLSGLPYVWPEICFCLLVHFWRSNVKIWKSASLIWVHFWGSNVKIWKSASLISEN